MKTFQDALATLKAAKEVLDLDGIDESLNPDEAEAARQIVLIAVDIASSFDATELWHPGSPAAQWLEPEGGY